MRVFVAGATGVVGRRLSPLLAAAGHEVVGMSRRAAPGLVTADALDREAVLAAVRETRPDAVVHLLSDLKAVVEPRRFEKQFAATNRLRTEGTDHLLAAAREVGVRRFVAARLHRGAARGPGAGLPARGGGARTPGVGGVRTSRRRRPALRHLLRPGHVPAEGGSQFQMVRARRFPLVGGGTGVWSFVHVDDAAAATVRAIEGEAGGVLDIVDDDPAPVSEWLPAFARRIGAPPPRRVPAWLAGLIAGRHTVSTLTDLHGYSNERARRELGWEPQHSWRTSMGT